MCAGEIGTCDELNLCGKSPAHDAGKNDTGTVPQGTCDGKPYCKDTNTKAVCTVKSGIGDTVETACSVGGCKDAKCGSCTSSTECKTTTQCKCQDGAFVSVEIGGTCSSGFCSLSFQGAAYCQSHGGSDKTYGDSVYHCDPSWQQQ